MSKQTVLIVEDDRAFGEVLKYNFIQAGFDVIRSSDGQDALNQARLRIPDVVLLDVMIPVMDGIEVCRRLRAFEETRKVLIVMMTAKGEEVDQLVGFSVGADDYVIKPFSVKVLMERVKALLRRKTNIEVNQDDVLSIHGIVIDRVRHRVLVDDINLEVTPSEFRLLEALMRQPGRAFDRSELIDSALGEDTLVLERTIDVHIRSLRKKLGEKADIIETVRGVGYRFRES